MVKCAGPWLEFTEASASEVVICVTGTRANESSKSISVPPEVVGVATFGIVGAAVSRAKEKEKENPS